MNVSAEEFNSYRDVVKFYTQHIIQRIKLNEGQRNFDLVLEIGPGPGNMTTLFADSINCNKIIGLEANEKMIEFAKKHHQRDNLSYIQCDVELPWDQLSEEVKQLQGKCSLIYSSNVLHWIKDINQFTDNLYRLLAPGGRIYTLSLPIGDLAGISQLLIETMELSDAIPLLKPGNFTRTWQLAITESGLQIETLDEFERVVIAPKRWIENFLVPATYMLLLKQAGNNMAQTLVKKHRNLLTENIHGCVTIDEKGQCRYDLKSLFLVAKK